MYEILFVSEYIHDISEVCLTVFCNNYFHCVVFLVFFFSVFLMYTFGGVSCRHCKGAWQAWQVIRSVCSDCEEEGALRWGGRNLGCLPKIQWLPWPQHDPDWKSMPTKKPVFLSLAVLYKIPYYCFWGKEIVGVPAIFRPSAGSHPSDKKILRGEKSQCIVLLMFSERVCLRF